MVIGGGRAAVLDRGIGRQLALTPVNCTCFSLTLPFKTKGPSKRTYDNKIYKLALKWFLKNFSRKSFFDDVQ